MTSVQAGDDEDCAGCGGARNCAVCMNSGGDTVQGDVQGGGDTCCEDAQSGTDCVTSVQVWDDEDRLRCGDCVTSEYIMQDKAM